MKHEFVGKAVFFPEQGILAIGDLHIGYEKMIIESGILVPEIQVKDILGDLEKTISKIKLEGKKIKKIVFLGDIKHFFNFEWSEKFNFNKIVEFLKKYVKENDIILIKGNHDKFDFSGKPMKNFYFNDGIIFLHGHKEFPEVFEKRVETIVMGHLHPSIVLRDKQNIKKEKYRCFLTGKYKRKEVVVVPSFPNIIRGFSMNELEYGEINKLKNEFSIIPYKNLKKFSVHAINDDGEVFDFGELRKL